MFPSFAKKKLNHFVTTNVSKMKEMLHINTVIATYTVFLIAMVESLTNDSEVRKLHWVRIILLIALVLFALTIAVVAVWSIQSKKADLQSGSGTVNNTTTQLPTDTSTTIASTAGIVAVTTLKDAILVETTAATKSVNTTVSGGRHRRHLPNNTLNEYEDLIKMLKFVIDSNKNPCNNFYEFTCNYYPGSMHDHITMRNINFLIRELEKPIDESEGRGVRIAKSFFQTCFTKNNATIEAFYDQLRRFLILLDPSGSEQIEQLSDFQIINIYLDNNFGENISECDNVTQRCKHLDLTKLWSTLFSTTLTPYYFPFYSAFSLENLVDTNMAHHDHNYKLYHFECNHLLTVSRAKTLISSMFSGILESSEEVENEIIFQTNKFLLDVSNGIMKSCPYYEKIRTVTNLTTATKIMGNNFQFEEFLRLAFNIDNISKLNNLTIRVTKEFFDNLEETQWHFGGPMILMNFLWRFQIKDDFNLLKLLNNMPSETNIEKKEKKFECLLESMQHASEAVDHIFISRIVNQHDFEEIKAYASNMVDIMLSSYQLMIEQKNWLNPKMKEYALRKLKKMKVETVAPKGMESSEIVDNYYSDFILIENQTLLEMKHGLAAFKSRLTGHLLMGAKITKLKFGMPLYIANAFYTPAENTVSLSIANFQPPSFHVSYPMPYVFGTTGHTIGHEISHGFDPEGIQFDEDGYRVDWVEESIYDPECLIDEFSNFCFNGTCIDGENTVTENMSDFAGLDAALISLDRLINENPTIFNKNNDFLERLNLTEKQLFFIGFSLGWCNISPKEVNVDDVHSPAFYRVYGTLRNNMAFRKEFGCMDNDTYAPIEFCDNQMNLLH